MQNAYAFPCWNCLADNIWVLKCTHIIWPSHFSFFNKYNLAILMNNRMNWNNNNNNNKLCFLAEEWFSLGSTVQPYQYKVGFLRLSEVKCCVHIEFVSILGDA